MVSVLAGLSAGIGSRADPVSAAIRDAAPQGEREGRDDAARRSAASTQATAALSGAAPTLRADAVQFLQGLNEDGSSLRDVRRSRSAEGEEPQAQSATGLAADLPAKRIQFLPGRSSVTGVPALKLPLLPAVRPLQRRMKAPAAAARPERPN